MSYLIVDVGGEGRVGDEPSHALDDLDVSLVDDDATVREDEVRDAVHGHALEDVEVDGVVVSFRGNGPAEKINRTSYFGLRPGIRTQDPDPSTQSHSHRSS